MSEADVARELGIAFLQNARDHRSWTLEESFCYCCGSLLQFGEGLLSGPTGSAESYSDTYPALVCPGCYDRFRLQAWDGNTSGMWYDHIDELRSVAELARARKESAASSAEPRPRPDGQMIRFRCPNCGLECTAKPDLAGKLALCRKCKTKLRVPPLPAPGSETPPPRGFATRGTFSEDHAKRRATFAALLKDPARPGYQRSPDDSMAPFVGIDEVPRVVERMAREMSKPQEEFYCACLSPDDRYLLTGGNDSTVKVWDVTSGQCVRSLESRVGSSAIWDLGHEEDVLAVCVSKDGSLILSGSRDHTIRLWTFAGECCCVMEGHTGSIASLDISRDGRWVISGGGDGLLRLWDLRTVKKPRMRTPKWLKSTPFQVWDLKTIAKPRILEGHSGSPHVRMTPDGKHAVSGSYDKSLKLWSLAKRRCIHSFDEHPDSIDAVDVSADGRFVVTGSRDGSLRLWDIQKMELVWVSAAHREFVSSVTFSSDARRVISSGEDGTIRIRDTATAQCLRTFGGPYLSLRAVCYSRRGQFVVSVGRLGQIRLWNLEQERAPAKKACQHCGAEKAWQSVPRGKRVFVERRQIEGMILQCNQCGRYTCYACAAEAGTETFVGDEKIGTELRCPACHAGPITQPQV